jgi:hypothetical protein
MKALDLIAPALQSITLAEIAQEAGIPMQSLKQYRLADSAAGHRKASPATQEALLSAIAKLARAQAQHFTKLAEKAAKGL